MEIQLEGKKILIVDDEKEIGDAISRFLSDENCLASVARTGKDALAAIETELPDCVVLDVKLPDVDGLELLKTIKKRLDIPVVMISGHGTIDLAVAAIKIGAHDFLEKPVHPEKLLVTISNALELSYFREKSRGEKEEEERRFKLIGNSRPMQSLMETVRKVGPTESKVLITGENGTGKEIVARALHDESRRRNGPFIKLNCAAIPENLVESELFGHERGAFTGAVALKKGKLEVATAGTLLLDEVGDMSLAAQAKLLRVIESGELERIGGTTTVRFNVRLLSASNKNLRREIERGNFREDLYFRLNVMPVEVPPLRERKEDIPFFVDYFLDDFSRINGKRRKNIEPAAVELFNSYSWPGNVRELRNIVERLAIMSDSGTITAADAAKLLVGGGQSPDRQLLTREMASKEKETILSHLNSSNWNVSLAASRLGIDRSNLHRKMKKYGLKRDPED